MFGKKEARINIDLEDVAIPEIHVHGQAKELKNADEQDHKPEIDYSGAIPEYHPKKKK